MKLRPCMLRTPLKGQSGSALCIKHNLARMCPPQCEQCHILFDLQTNPIYSPVLPTHPASRRSYGDRSADSGTGARWMWPICNTLKSNRGSQARCHAAVSLDLQTEVVFSEMRSARAMMGITGCFTEIFVLGFFRDAV